MIFCPRLCCVERKQCLLEKCPTNWTSGPLTKCCRCDCASRRDFRERLISRCQPKDNRVVITVRFILQVSCAATHHQMNWWEIDVAQSSREATSSHAAAFCLLCLANHSSLLSSAMAWNHKSMKTAQWISNTCCIFNVMGEILEQHQPYQASRFLWGPPWTAAWKPRLPQSRFRDHPKAKTRPS